MASLSRITKGWRTGWRLRISVDGTRHSVWLGDVRKSEAEAIKAHVNALEQSHKLGTPIPAETQRWISKMPSDLRQRLNIVLDISKTVTQLVAIYTAHVQKTHKETTARSVSNTLTPFADQFGSELIRTLTSDQIDQWLRTLNVSESTLGAHVKILRTWMRWCTAGHYLDATIAISTPATIGVGEKEMIDWREFQRVIEHYGGDAEMQAILALSRWSGLRIASEVVTLRRSSIDLENFRINIDDSKRSHRQSRGPPKVRSLPLSKSLWPYLKVLLDQPGKPHDYLLPTLGGQNAQRVGSRLRSRVYRALDKLGIAPWPRVFHSPRATRQTEMKAAYGEKAACNWIGNTPDVSRRNYELIDDETFARAVDE